MASHAWQTGDCPTGSCNATKVLKIGASLTLDPEAKYGPISRQVKQAYLLYFEIFNELYGGVTIKGEKHWLQLTLMDDRSEKQTVESITKHLIGVQGIKLLLGPYSSGLTEPAAKIANKNGAVMVAPCAATTSVFKNRPFIFGTLPPASMQLVNVFEKLSKPQIPDPPSTVGYVYEDKIFSIGVCNEISSLAKKRNMKVIFGTGDEGKLPDNADQTTVDEMIRKIQDKTTPDLFIGCVYDNVCRRILKAARKFTFDPKAIVFTVCVSADNFRDEVGDVGGYVMGVTPWTKELVSISKLIDPLGSKSTHSKPSTPCDKVKAGELPPIQCRTEFNNSYFVRRFEKVFGGSIPYQAASAFASASSLVTAIRQSDSTEPAKVANVLKNMDVASVFGKIKFDSNGQGGTPIKVIQVQASSSPVIAPDSVATAQVKYPKPSVDAMRCLNTQKYYVGRYGIFPNGSCLECSMIQVAPYNETEGYRVCEKMVCEAGKRSVIFKDSDEGGASAEQNGTWICRASEGGICKAASPVQQKAGAYCQGCFPGYFAVGWETDAKTKAKSNGSTSCVACAVGKHQDESSRSECKICQPGRFAIDTGSVHCSKCPAGRYTSMKGSSGCHACPPGGVCVQTNGLYVDYTNAKGWSRWVYEVEKGFTEQDREEKMPEDREDEMKKCRHGPGGSACLPGNKCHIDPSTGEAAMEGPFCGKCRLGYGRMMADNLCTECPNLFSTVLLCILNVSIMLAVALAVYIMVLWTDLTKPKNFTAIIFKQLLNYVGMSTVILQATDFRFPIDLGLFGEVAGFFRIFCGTSSPLFAAHAGECFASKIESSYKVYVTIGLVWVPLQILFLSIVFWSVWLYQKRRGDKPVRRSRLMTIIICNVFVIHPRNTELLLVVFRCGTFDRPRLMMDTSVDCTSQEHVNWQILGLIGFCIYSLGIPLGVFLLLRLYKRRDKLHKNKTVETLGFLYSGFEPQCYYFEAVFMIRKVLYQLVILIPPLAASEEQDDRVIKCMSMTVLAVIFLAIHIKCEPYDNRSYFTLDRIESRCLWAILVTLLVQTWLFITDKAYAFNELENGDAAWSRTNRDIRDMIGFTIVAVFHARFFFLLIFLMIRPYLLTITRWKILDHGFVEVEENGLQLIDHDSTGQKLFTTMFQELVALLVDAKRKVSYDELIASVKFMCINCSYHRTKEKWEKGLDDDDDEHVSVYASVGNIADMASRCKQLLDKGIIFHLKNASDAIRAMADGEEVHRRKEYQRRMPPHVKEKLHGLMNFSNEAINHCIGERYSIEELHLAVVRLSREIGRSLHSKLKESGAIRNTVARQPEITTSVSGMGFEGLDDGDDGEIGWINRLDRSLAKESELRHAMAELQSLRTTHEEIIDSHATRVEEMETRHRELMHRIADHLDGDGVKVNGVPNDMESVVLRAAEEEAIAEIENEIGEEICANCDTGLGIIAVFCHSCGHRKGAVPTNPKPPKPSCTEHNEREELEEATCRARLQLESLEDTVRSQAQALKEAWKEVAAEQGLLDRLKKDPLAALGPAPAVPPVPPVPLSALEMKRQL